MARQFPQAVLDLLLDSPDLRDRHQQGLVSEHGLAVATALVDIISMIKHAADDNEPLYTAQERVDRAVWQVTAGRSFTAEQEQWLHRIREHLVRQSFHRSHAHCKTGWGLVPRNSMYSRREGRDYEPASVLLERIKGECERATTASDGAQRPARFI